MGRRNAVSANRLLLRLGAVAAIATLLPAVADPDPEIGRESAVTRHLEDGEEFALSAAELVAHGQMLFTAKWTPEDGVGRPLSKGTGAVLSDPSRPLVFPRNFNRLSGPDANSCFGCHNQPHGIPGGSGEFTANVFVLAQRFDSLDFDPAAEQPTVKSRDEAGRQTTLGEAANGRVTVGLFGSGYIELLAREMTADLRAIRDATLPGESRALVTKGISFGTIRRIEDGRWDVSRVEGLPESSLTNWGSDDSPDLTIRPFHQAGAAISLREFTNTALNHHHGIQSPERFGYDRDRDGDGVVNELTRADVTALTIFQATMPVPGRVIPRERAIEEAVLAGERIFGELGCSGCHVPALPLDSPLFEEPGPYNPARNLQQGHVPVLTVDLNDPDLPPPRLAGTSQTWVPAFTDLKLHDITAGPDDPNREPLDMHVPPGLDGFFGGNGSFITRRLWGVGNQSPYFHHGKFTTLREAILAHAGEAEESARAFRGATARSQAEVIEFLKSLQALPPGTPSRFVDEHHRPRRWPPAWAAADARAP